MAKLKRFISNSPRILPFSPLPVPVDQYYQHLQIAKMNLIAMEIHCRQLQHKLSSYYLTNYSGQDRFATSLEPSFLPAPKNWRLMYQDSRSHYAQIRFASSVRVPLHGGAEQLPLGSAVAFYLFRLSNGCIQVR